MDIEELKHQLIIASFDFPVEEIGLVERDGMLVPLNFCVHAFDAIESLQRELEEVRRDAERYRFIRKFNEETLNKIPDCMFDENDEMLWGASLDDAIDSARQQTEGL